MPDFRATAGGDGFGYGVDISNAFGGMTLSAVGSAADGRAYAYFDPSYASTGTNIFAWGQEGTVYGFWSDTVCLRADFDEPMNCVAIDMIGNNGSDYGVLRAYDSSGVLLTTRLSPLLTNGEMFTAEVFASGITYVIAGGRYFEGVHQTVCLDHLVAIPEPASLALLSTGALLALRRRRGHRGSSPMA